MGHPIWLILAVIAVVLLTLLLVGSIHAGVITSVLGSWSRPG